MFGLYIGFPRNDSSRALELLRVKFISILHNFKGLRSAELSYTNLFLAVAGHLLCLCYLSVCIELDCAVTGGPYITGEGRLM